MKFIAGLRVWRNWGIVENVLKVFLKLRGSANRRVDLFLPLIASISGRRHGAWGERRVAGGQGTLNAKRGTSRLAPHASRLNDVGGGQPRFPAARKQVAPFRLRDLEGRVNSAFLNISQHFTGHLFRLWIPSSARGQGGGPRRFTAIVLNVSRRRFGGPEGVEPQSPGERNGRCSR